jgi:AcrR family transcriptional regulator
MTSHGQAAAGPARRGRYHHGDLRQALIETAIAMLGERGAEAFSLAEASRRLGVAASAPYRHFADRDALLAAVALRAAGLLAEQLDRSAASGTPAQRLAAAARAYVHFADDQRPLFRALAGSGLNKDAHPEIAAAAQAIGTAFLSPAAELASGSQAAAARLASAIVATAHGHAVLMLDGMFGSGRQAAQAAAEQAAAATLALISGRDWLTPSSAADRLPGND